MAGLFAGFPRCRFVTPSLVLFIMGYFGPMPLVSQYIYTLVLRTELKAANVTLTPNDRLIPCENDTSTPQYEVQMRAQSKSSMILMGTTLSSSLPAMLMILFWGPLSDKWGRKPILLIAYVGAIAQVIFDFFGIVYKWDPYLFYIGNAVQGFSGGTMAIFCAASSYITDVSTPKTRTLRIYIMEGSFFIAMGITFMSAGMWAKASKSFAQPFLGSFAFLFLGFIYTTFIMAESKTVSKPDGHNESTSSEKGSEEVEKEKKPKASIDRSVNGEVKDTLEITSTSSCCSFILSPFVRTITAFRTEGDQKWNLRLILPLLIFGISFAANVGGRSAQSLFEENAPFCWDTDWMAQLGTIKLFAGTFISILTLVSIRKLNLNIGDYPLVAVCIALSIVSHVIYGFSKKDWHLYVGSAVGLLSLRFPLLRAAVSKECSKDKIGAVFAGVSFMETAANLLGTMGFSPLYAQTVYFFPGFSFLIMALLEVIAIGLLIPLIIKRLWKKEVLIKDFDPLQEERD